MVLATATRGTKPHKNGCLLHQTRSLPTHLTSVSLVDGVLTLLNVVSRLSQSPRSRAEAFGAACEFHSTQRESSNVWRLRALCANNSERWNANIRFAISGSKLTWSSERGTTTYVRCPS